MPTLFYLIVGTAPHENSTEKFDLDNVGTSQEFPSMQLDILQAATNGFSDENKLGQGGFGHVYKGTLADGKEIAVKSSREPPLNGCLSSRMKSC
ncbi:hypothetical protein HRI_000945600 [Hibiscus trionum]|uniref:Protein kinase domain-containing protein n=1 Tax=Hibiscus trionum TaxID=183268 RepID=A0A9W7H8Q8_HIBTR|nr:hypothetical protein HRI_000945600 [Hibiscus trionum]